MPGGKRQGAGRPTQFSLKQQQEKLKKDALLLEEEKARDARAAYERMRAAAERGEAWAIRAMFEHTHGKAATRAQETPDTEITLIAALPIDGKIAIGDEMVAYDELVRAWKAWKGGESAA